MLRDAPAFDAVAARLLQVMDGAVWVAHNAPFDLGFLSAELGLIGQSLPQHPVVDTLMLARRAYRFPRNNLPAVAAALEVDAGTAHRALGDVQTTFGVLERMRQDLAQRRGVTTLGQLITLQGGPVAIPPQNAPRELTLPPVIAEALENGGRVHMRYVDARGRESERVVRPLHVRARGETLYLIAHCYRRDAQRTFRLDRVLELTPES
jgi:DNA polymerase III epsilon subunit-like protein